MSDSYIQVRGLTHRYDQTAALNDVSFDVVAGGLFGLLGPNGSGKTTLFRLLATLLPVQAGTVTVGGHDLKTAAAQVRQSLGVTFQSPAVDVRLTVQENLHCHGRIYAIPPTLLKQRIAELLDDFDLDGRRDTVVGELSGGLRRRVELAKGLLHRPRLLLLDEPSTGLDPAARQRFWELVDHQRRQHDITVIVTTHLMEEAEGCDQILLLDNGQVVAEGRPQELQASLAGERLTVRTRRPEDARPELEQLLQTEARRIGDRLCFRLPDAAARLPDVIEALKDEVLSAEVARPTLEDVFLEMTNRELQDSDGEHS